MAIGSYFDRRARRGQRPRASRPAALYRRRRSKHEPPLKELRYRKNIRNSDLLLLYNMCAICGRRPQKFVCSYQVNEGGYSIETSRCKIQKAVVGACSELLKFQQPDGGALPASAHAAYGCCLRWIRRRSKCREIAARRRSRSVHHGDAISLRESVATICVSHGGETSIFRLMSV